MIEYDKQRSALTATLIDDVLTQIEPASPPWIKAALRRPFAFSRPLEPSFGPPEPPPSRATDPIPSLFRCEKARLGHPRPFA